jgi:hypothetical protein
MNTISSTTAQTIERGHLLLEEGHVGEDLLQRCQR